LSDKLFLNNENIEIEHVWDDSYLCDALVLLRNNLSPGTTVKTAFPLENRAFDLT